MKTLSRPLVLGLLLVALTTGGLSAWATYRAAGTEADELLDAQLAHSARSLQVLAGSLLDASVIAPEPARTVPVWGGEAQALGAAPQGALGHVYERQLAFLAWRGERLLLRSENAPPLAAAELSPGFSEFEAAGQRWRGFRLQTDDGLQFAAVEPLALRQHIASRIARGVLLPLLLELPLLALLIWLVVRAGSRSLRRMAKAVSAQAGDALQPIARSRLPVEIHGLVDAINSLLGRVDETLRRERRFIDEAAHELRTPIAGLRLHLSNLEAAVDADARDRALAQSQRGLRRLERAVAQLLTLSRLGPAAPQQRPEPIELGALLRGLLAEWVDSGLLEGAELELDCEAPLWLSADPESLGILLRNLVDNALRHGGRPAELRIEASAEDGCAVLAVEDQGPGIAPAEHERVFDSFYRVPGSGGEGSGLGLSIVARIAERMGGRVQLGHGRDGRGLRVELHVPRAAPRPTSPR